MAYHPKYDLKKASNGQFMFNLTAGNGQVILTSELYTTKANAMNGIEAVRSNAVKDERYQRKTATNGQYYFNLIAANNQVIGTSEMYTAVSSRENGIESVKTNSWKALVEDNAK